MHEVGVSRGSGAVCGNVRVEYGVGVRVRDGVPAFLPEIFADVWLGLLWLRKPLLGNEIPYPAEVGVYPADLCLARSKLDVQDFEKAEEAVELCVAAVQPFSVES